MNESCARTLTHTHIHTHTPHTRTRSLWSVVVLLVDGMALTGVRYTRNNQQHNETALMRDVHRPRAGQGASRRASMGLRPATDRPRCSPARCFRGKCVCVCVCVSGGAKGLKAAIFIRKRNQIVHAGKPRANLPAAALWASTPLGC